MSTNNRIKITGAIFGLIIGLVFIWQGLTGAIIVGLLVAGGWLIGKYVAGEFPLLDDLLARYLSGRTRPED